MIDHDLKDGDLFVRTTKHDPEPRFGVAETVWTLHEADSLGVETDSFVVSVRADNDPNSTVTYFDRADKDIELRKVTGLVGWDVTVEELTRIVKEAGRLVPVAEMRRKYRRRPEDTSWLERLR